MGLYVNPNGIDKVEFLRVFGREITKPASFAETTEDDSFLVVLVDNRVFSAAGVVWCPREFEEFVNSANDTRAKRYFIVKRELLREVCQDYNNYIIE